MSFISYLGGIINNAIKKGNARKTPTQISNEKKKQQQIQANIKKRRQEAQLARNVHRSGAPVVLQGVTLLDQRTPSSDKKTNQLRQAGREFSYNLLARAGYGGTGVSGGSGSDSDLGYGSDGGYYGGSGGTSGYGSSGSSNYVKSSMTKAERNAIYKMKDSNVPYFYEQDENDLMYLAASEKKDSYWGLKEEMFLYTIHDRQKHRYITSIQIDSDAKDIVTTCTVDMPYKPELIDYYIPGKTAFMVIGGTFDREVLFIGRVSETNQMGDSIQVVAQNIGWKFKQYMSDDFYKKIQGLPVPMVVKAIFKHLGFTEGKYHMDLWAIPNVFKYRLDENAGVTYKGEAVQNVPELTEIVERMKKSDINKYVASRAKLRETQDVADDYNKHVKLSSLNSVVKASNSYYPSFYRKNYGIKTSLKAGEVSYDPLMDRLYGKDDSLEYLTKDKSGDGEYTYEDVLVNIASAIDAQFFIVDTTVCFVSFNALMAMGSSEAVAKSIQPRIDFWQMQEDSYELDINQYGYYNTVIIKYKNGTLKRSFEDLVRVYGEIAVTYEEKSLNYEAAQLKAQAYLAAHVRDFGMEVKATILYTGKICVSNFIKIQNPLTMSESLFYVYGISVQWDASNQTLICDLDLRYGPENPDGLEVPEVGMGYTGGNANGIGALTTTSVSAGVSQAVQQMTQGAFTQDQRVEMIYDWFAKNVGYSMYYNSRQSVSTTLRGRSANCDDTTEAFYECCTAAGIPCEKIHGTLVASSTWGHYWCRVQYKGKMEICDLGRGVKRGIGKYSGKLIYSSTVKKNY